MKTAENKELGDRLHRSGPEIDSLPWQFIWQGNTHTVAEITRYWRVDIDWWRERIWRAYFKLSTDTGLLVVIYQDLMTNAWYLQRLYD